MLTKDFEKRLELDKIVDGKLYRYYVDLTAQEIKDIVFHILQKPSVDSVEYQLREIYHGRNTIPKIEKYFFYDIMSLVKTLNTQITIDGTLKNKIMMDRMVGKIVAKQNVFSDKNLIVNCHAIFRLAGSVFGVKPPNYFIESVKSILEKYNTNGNYYDYSCGWGSRLLGSLVQKVNYFGTDPNYLLTERLNELYNMYTKVNNSKTKAIIKTQGSEVFVPEFENKMGIAFSSPPYYNQEDYRIGEQSFTEGVSYDEWLNTYWLGTVKNIRKYLVQDGFFLLNMKNMKDYKLLDDMRDISLENGFDIFGLETLKNITRHEGLDNDEDIIVFVDKDAKAPQINTSSLESFFD